MKVIEHPARDFPERRYFNQETNEFVIIPAMHLEPMRLQLEHSLLSMRKYEAQTHRPFNAAEGLNPDELLEYVKCMTINTQKDDKVYGQLTPNDLQEIVQYIQDASSAWEIKERVERKPQRKNLPKTVEAIYFAMIQYGIPFECEKWHLNSLLALIDYCFRNGGTGGGGSGPRKTEKEMREYWRAMNEANRKKYHSKG